MGAGSRGSSEKSTVSVRLSLASARRLRVTAAKQGLSMGGYLARLWERSQTSGARKKDARGEALTSATNTASLKQ